MTRAPWIAQAYGYLVCIVAVITLLINVSGFIDATFDRANPIQARSFVGGGSLTSFEAFRATQAERGPMRPTATGPAPGDTLTTSELRARYDALLADHVAQVRYESMRRLVRNGFLILLAIGLFASHWRWLRAQREPVG